MHQGAWLVWALCGGLVAISTTNPFYLLPLFAATLAVHLTRHTSGPGIRSFRVFVLFGLITIVTRTLLVFVPFGGGGVTTGTVLTGLLEGLRLAVVLAVYGAFNSVSDPFQLLKLAPRRFHEPALAAALALSIAPRTLAAAARVREAQRLRGVEVARWRSLPALAVPVLETGMEEAVMLAESMDARGHGRGPRSRYRPQRWSVEASAISLTSAGAAALFVAALLGGGETLAVTTLPPQWPHASPVLVLASLVLALPAFFQREQQ